MTALKLKPTHGGRGPKPKTFGGWVYSASKRGAKRFRVHLQDGTEKLLAHKNAPDTTKRIEALAPTKVEAIDENEAEVGEWEFPEPNAAQPEAEPGYTIEDDDSETVRTLKTFAHLLADAHKLSAQQLVEVVSIQSKHFAEERKNLLQMQLASERLLAKRLRLPTRFRVDPDGEEGGEEETETEGSGGGEDTWLQEMLAPIAQRMAMRMAGGIVDNVAGQPNGEAKPPAKEKS